MTTDAREEPPLRFRDDAVLDSIREEFAGAHADLPVSNLNRE